MKISSQLSARLSHVQLLLCDVDGVLTDGTIIMDGRAELKRFNIRDGLGLRLLQGQGIRVGWVSARPSKVTTQRAEELQIDFLSQTKTGKVAAVEKILKQAHVGWREVCYIGDDVVDLAVLRRAGVGVAPGNGIEEARAMAHYVTRAPGGSGAVREVVELILKAQGKWAPMIEKFKD
jgi:3-deoxy-D-manno-octulosonate 8-phosphate phosphatase (KDO 8-P phosphatase)